MEVAQKSWFAFEPLVLISNHRTLQKRFIDAYAPYEHLAEQYRSVTKREVYPITEEYLTENPEVTEQNIALLKNAMELWRNASQTTAAIAPILFHYSWHCFNSFFAYTFFRWKPQHGSSHGIDIPSETMDADISNANIRVKEENKQGETKGLFQRLIDSWALLGTSPAFSGFVLKIVNSRIEFQPNELYLLKTTKRLSLKQLLDYDPVNNYERAYWKIDSSKIFAHNLAFSNSMNLPTRILQSYLILFFASSVARYRPIVWSNILAGRTGDEVNFALSYRHALLTYAQFGINSQSFLHQFSSLINQLKIGQFKIW